MPHQVIMNFRSMDDVCQFTMSQNNDNFSIYSTFMPIYVYIVIFITNSILFYFIILSRGNFRIKTVSEALFAFWLHFVYFFCAYYPEVVPFFQSITTHSLQGESSLTRTGLYHVLVCDPLDSIGTGVQSMTCRKGKIVK